MKKKKGEQITKKISEKRVPQRDYGEVNLLGNYRSRAKIDVFGPDVFGFVFDANFEEKQEIRGPPRSPKQWKCLYEMKMFGSGN